MKVFLLFIPFFLGNYLSAQYVGIGTSAPYSPLTFNNNSGQKISLYGTAVNNYGFGVVGNTLQIHSDAIASDIAFGYGNSAAFTQIMRMMGNGNVGIGTTSPQVRLDITGSNGWDLVNTEGDFRLGNSAYRLKIGVALSGVGAGAVGLMQFGTTSGYNALALGSQGKNLITLYGNNNVVELANVPNGKVGIGTGAPFSPLTFNNITGEKISLYGTTDNNYGFGVQGALLQIHSSEALADIAFGYGSSAAFTEIMRMKGTGVLQFPPALAKKIILYPGSTGDVSLGVFGNELRLTSDNPNADITFGYDTRPSTFTERMRISGNGNVGIGAYPFYLLDVNGRMRIRSSGDFSGTAGLWLNNMANVEKVFIGMEDDTHAGFYSTSSGWKLSVNTETGALKVNGNDGAPGQVITSNGTASPEWKSPTNSLYNNTQEFFQTSSINITGFNDVPGLTQTITVPACKVMLIVKGTLSLNSCFNCGLDPCRFDIWVDGTNIERYEEIAGNGQTIHVTNGAKIHSLTAGTHTIAVKVDGPYGRYWDVSGFKLVIFAIPQ